MPNHHPPGSFLRRMLRMLGRVLLLVCFLSWLGKTIYLWAIPSAYLNYEPWARAYLAGRDSLYVLPETVQYVVAVCAQFLRQAYGLFVSDLGYDPLALPDFQPLAFASFPSFSMTSGGALDAAVTGSVMVGVALSLGQFIQLFIFSAVNLPIGWRHPGVPVLMAPLASALFGLVSVAAVVWLSFMAFTLHPLAGVTGALIGFLLVWRPVIAGFPLWLLMIFGLFPQQIVLIPFTALATLFRALIEFLRGGGGPGDGGAGAQSGQSWTGTETGNEDGSDQGEQTLPAESGPDDRLGDACSTFSLSIEEFTDPEFSRDVLVAKYRDLARKLHPHAQGSERLMRLLNEDYEYLLAYKGWKR